MTARSQIRPTVGTILRCAVYAGIAVVFGWHLTVQWGLVAAGIGAGLGVLLAESLSRSRVRLAGVVGIAAVVGLMGSGLARWLVTIPTVAEEFGALEAFGFGEAVLWFSIVGPLACVIRLTASRRPSLGVLEAAMVAMALAASVAAHRGGMIHRPTELVDQAWLHGIDPVYVLLALGFAGSFLVAAMLFQDERKRRAPLHFAVLALAALVLALVVRVWGMPEPRAGSDLGLTGEPSDQQSKGDQKAAGSAGGQKPQGSSGGGGGQPAGGSQAKASQVEDLQFRDDYQSSGADAPVAVVVMHADYSPPSGIYYFRQSAFSQFNGRRLVQATAAGMDQDLLARFPGAKQEVPTAPPASDERMELDTTIGLLTDHVRPFALDSPALIWPVQNPDRLRFRRVYAVRSHALVLEYENMLGHMPGDPDWTEDQWKNYTAFPADERYKTLATQAVEILKPEFRGDPLGQAIAVKTWIDKNCIYSRKSQHADAGDPTASFLFGDRIGYCVHFAHAAVFLLRSLGVPARVAAGYAIQESDRGGGSTIMIRGGSAHAWPEVYLEGVGWVVVDLSPERSLDPPEGAPDQGLQRMLGQMLRAPAPKDEPPPEEPKPRLTVAQLIRSVLVLLAMSVYLAYVVKLQRALAPRWAAKEHLYRVAYCAALDRLSDVGLRRGHAESREAFAQRVSGIAPSFAELTGAHLGGALGSARALDVSELRRLARQTETEVRRGTPSWRWLLGTLNPFSWLSSR